MMGDSDHEDLLEEISSRKDQTIASDEIDETPQRRVNIASVGINQKYELGQLQTM